ncbi:MAG: ATP-binding protein [Bacteroidales bacterium]|nr:ATP-binding protein [Bacteroidales bacterium]
MNMKPNNPFIITSEYLGSAYFCDREFETKVLTDNILNGRNTVLVSDRRMGKSGLIAHAFDQAAVRDTFRTFSVDLYATTSLSEMVFLLAKEIIGPLKSHGKKALEGFWSVVKSLRPGFKLDAVSGQFVFDLALGEIRLPQESLKEIFQYLESSRTPCIVAMDEFQQIAEYPEGNVIELLRGYVQKCKHTGFVFAGSKRRMMEKLFNSPSEPFYMSCSPLYLEAIPQEAYLRFASRHFNEAGKRISHEAFRRIYGLFEGHTWYVQRMLNELYAWTPPGDAATEDFVQPVLDHLLKLGARAFKEQLSTMAESQKRLLIAVAREGKVPGVTSYAFCKKHALKSPSTAQSAIRSLYEKELVTRDGTVYSVTNRLFGLWLRNEYGE